MKKPKFFLIPPLILALCLTLCAALAAATDTPEVVASGECGADGGNVTWTLDSAGTLTISGTGDMADYTYATRPLREVEGQIKTAVLTTGITSIGNYAFYGCSGLTSVTIPDGVISIGGCAFYGCSGLTSVTIPDSVTSIGNAAFDDCSGLTSVTIPKGVTKIKGFAFCGCSGLTSVTIPDSVTSIAESAFYGCSGLTSVTIPQGVTSIGMDVFAACSGLTSVTIPDSVTSIEYEAFYGCSALTSVTIPQSVTSIGYYAFYGCSSLTNVIIPQNVTDIGSGAFSCCDSLVSVQMDSDNNHFSSEDGVLFNKDRITLLCYPAGKTDSSYQIPDSVTNIKSFAFSGCSGLTSVTIPEGVTSIGESAFCGCHGLTSVTMPDSVTNINYSAFASCGRMKSVYYAGSKVQWKEIQISKRNEGITLWADIYYDGNRETPGRVTSNIPKIALTYTPAYGDKHNFEGIVYTEDGSEFDVNAYRVTLYVDGAYPKPSSDNPSVSLKEDGSFSLYYTIASVDDKQTFLDLMLIPADFDQKNADYEKTRRAAVDYVEVYRTEQGDVTVYPEREISPDLGYAISATQTDATRSTLSLTNRTGAAIEAQFAVAAYNADGRMIALNMKTTFLDRVKSDNLTVSYSADDGVTQIRAFILSADTFAPLRSAWVKKFE